MSRPVRVKFVQPTSRLVTSSRGVAPRWPQADRRPADQADMPSGRERRVHRLGRHVAPASVPVPRASSHRSRDVSTPASCHTGGIWIRQWTALPCSGTCVKRTLSADIELPVEKPAVKAFAGSSSVRRRRPSWGPAIPLFRHTNSFVLVASVTPTRCRLASNGPTDAPPRAVRRGRRCVEHSARRRWG